MKTEINQDLKFFRDFPEICRAISESVDKNVYSLKMANSNCVSRLFNFDKEPDQKMIVEVISNYISREIEPLSVGLFSFDVLKAYPNQYKLKVYGELKSK